LNLLKTYIPSLSYPQWDILDLGCGTGLSGFAFRDQAKILTGVDLSEKMLHIAERKAIYDYLILDDIIDFLDKNKINYDLILAADTFNYIGDLNKLLGLCKLALKNKAYLVFSLELLEDQTKNWILEPHGRYLHSKHYIEKIALEQGFRIIAIENAALREQNHSPVNGCLCLFQT
jgi:predicted TPR repeat methyltransferase